MWVPWVWVALCLAQCACGGSLRGAVEALQRRQRAPRPAPDYDALYEFVPPGYSEPDYAVDVDYAVEDPTYLMKLLDDKDRAHPNDAYEYKIVKKNSRAHKPSAKESAFREKSQRDNDKLKDLFTGNNDPQERKQISQEYVKSEAEYDALLNQLWSNYKTYKAHRPESVSQGVVKLYKEKERKKRYPDNWGPIAFKRKRSSGSETSQHAPQYYENERKQGSDPSYNSYDASDDDNDDWRDEYAIAFQPLDDDSASELGDESRYSLDSIEKRFPVTKRSSGSYEQNYQKRFSQTRSDKTKTFRSSSGTDPRIIKDLSKIFGEDFEVIKTPVKRNTDSQSHTHETKPPKVTVMSHNGTHELANSEVDSHEQHQGHLHHPGHEGMKEIELSSSNTHDQHQGRLQHPGHEGIKEMEFSGLNTHDQHQGHLQHPGHEGMKEIELSGSNTHDPHQGHLQHPGHEDMKEIELSSSNTYDPHQGHMHHPGHEGMKEIELSSSNKNENLNDNDHNKQIIVRKKSIDWSDYFGIDKRFNKLVNDGSQNLLKKQYFDTFNKQVIYPLKAFREHSLAKRNYREAESESESHGAHEVDKNHERKTPAHDNSNLSNLDETLKDMEEKLVDEALHYSDSGEELDSAEEQEMKEKLLSQLAAAYSLEKMRKALKEFKQNLQTQKASQSAPQQMDEVKSKRVAVKKELMNNDIPIYNQNQQPSKFDEFEEEQGAGHYLNGREHQFSEGYMGSGRHRSPVLSTVGAPGACPVLTKIVQRCRNVDNLAGDHGQLFLPLCSLHQICYLCSEAPQTTCDLVFLSEADTSCEGDMDCQQAARAALMALRDLHDNLADELDGECEASPCLARTLKLNLGWQRALH